MAKMTNAEKDAAKAATVNALNKAKFDAQAPVTETGVELLARIQKDNGLYLTQAQAADGVAAGTINPDKANVQGDTVLCTLTEAGVKALPTIAKTGKVQFAIDDDVAMPSRVLNKGGAQRGSKYPFDDLPVGKSFHVPATADLPDPATALQSSLTGARRKYQEPVVDADGHAVMEDHKVISYQIDPVTKKRVKGADGAWIKTGESVVKRQKQNNTRDFFIVTVDATDPKGPGARVFRNV